MKYLIKANKEQLNRLGIVYEITGLVGTLKYKYPTGFYEIEVTHKVGAITVTNSFDIPKTFLKPTKP
jgi:hypothetical protein